MTEPVPADEPSRRLPALDFLRGVAVLGILLMNVVGYAWPGIAVLSPRVPVGPQGAADDAVFLAQFVLVDGKMRGLFSLLFGAGLLLLVERTEAAGGDGIGVQARRLAWLALFGLAHFFLLWWGDILFLYAVCGFFALAAIDWPARRLALVAVALQAGGILLLGALTLPDAAPWFGGDGDAQAEALRAAQGRFASEAAEDRATYLASWPEAVARRLTEHAQQPFAGVMTGALDTVALMLFGMALLKSGLFARRWPRRRVACWAACGIAAGLAWTVPLAWWVAAAGYPMPLMLFAGYALAVPGRLAMTLGYVALLVLLAPGAAGTRLGRRVIAAGRMAFSNYLGTSLLMAALFHGWGLGLYGRLSRLDLMGVVALAWLAMLLWSAPWLRRFRHGPLEWLWRSLVQRRMAPLQRVAIASDLH